MATYDLTSSIPSASTIKTGDILNCPYSGNKITLKLPAGTYKLQCWGAQGGYNSDVSGYEAAKAGYSVGTLTLKKETTLYLYAGGKGSVAKTNTSSGFAGGFNGGGNARSSAWGRGSGGGGTDIRIGADSLYARAIVAGGSAGSTGKTNGMKTAVAGGYGGGVEGQSGTSVTGTSPNTPGTGGTQTAGGTNSNSTALNGAFGQGGSETTGKNVAGGGGGWYGGAAGNAAGGGSGYVYTASTAANYPSGCLLNSDYYLTDASTYTGITSFPAATGGGNETGHAGNGYIRITVTKVSSGKYIINEKGSTTFNYPEKINAGDKLIFNITNTNETTGYMGTLIPYEIPVNCKIKITAKGSRGGYGNFYTHAVSDTTKSGRGASCTATFEFKKGDKLLLLVGQHGKDAATATGSTRDGVTGGGGGMSVVALEDDTASYTFVGHTKNNSTQYAGKKYKPLIVAAGGNGARDNGYSGTGTVYHGQAHTTSAEAVGSTSNTNCPGGTFSKQRNTSHGDNSNYRHGLSFLYGGLGSQYDYVRGGMSSLGGFGGGGANYDDGNGGGAGGWISGYRGVAAKSYIDNTIATDRSSIAGDNADDGIIIFEILEAENAPLLYSKNNANQLVSSRNNYVYVNSTLKYKKIKELYVKTASNGWVKAT